jgi:hypothetical protein
MPYRLNLTKLSKLELERLLSPQERASLTLPRFLRRDVLSPDDYPDSLELEIAQEEHWDALGASVQHAVKAKENRDILASLEFVQVNAYRLKNMPYQRNFFAYIKDADTFAAVYLADASGIAPYVEMFTLFKQPQDGKIGILTSSAGILELDPAPELIVVHLPEKHPEVVFNLHRSKVMEFGKANKPARKPEHFDAAYLQVWNANYQSWIARGVLKAV